MPSMRDSPFAARALFTTASALAAAAVVVCPLLVDPAALQSSDEVGFAIDGTLTAKRAGLQLAATLAAACALLGVAIGARRPSWRLGAFEGLSAAFVGLAAISATWAEQPAAAAEVAWMLFAAALIGIAVKAASRFEGGARRWLALAAAGALTAGLVDAVVRRGSFGIDVRVGVEGAEKFRTVWFPHTNVAALLLAPLAAGALGWAWSRVGIRARIGCSVLFLVATGLVFDLGSRTGLCAILLAGPVFAIGRVIVGGFEGLRSRSRAARALVATLIVVLISLAVVVPRHPKVSAVLKEAFNRTVAWTGVNYQAAYMRPGLWESTFAVAADHDALGVGAGNLFYELPRVDSIEPFRPHAHNQYLQVLAELGFLGLSLFIGLLVLGLVRAARAPPSPAARSIGMALTCFAVTAGLETPMQFPFTALVFFGLVGAACGLERGARPHELAWRPIGGASRAAAGVIAVLMTWTGASAALAPILQLEKLRGAARARAAGDPELALQCLDQASAVGRDHFALHAPRAAIEMQQGMFADAVESWTAAVARFPANWRFHEQRAIALARTDRFGEALEALAEVDHLNPAAPDLRFWRGQIRLYEGRLDEAVEAFEIDRVARPAHVASMRMLGTALYRRAVRDRSLDDARASLAAYRGFLGAGGEDPTAWVSRRAAQLGHWLRREEIDVEPTSSGDDGE